MLVRHDLVTPEMNQTLFLNKPPLMYWLAAGAFALGARDEWARVASVLAAMVSVFFTCRLGARLFDDVTGLLAGAFLATMFGFVLEARTLRPDGVLVASRGGGALLLAASRRARRIDAARPGWRSHVASLAIGFMAKGAVPVAVVAIPVVACTVRDHGWRGIGRLRPLARHRGVPARGRALARRRRLATPGLRVGLRRQPAPALLLRQEAAARLGGRPADGLLVDVPRPRACRGSSWCPSRCARRCAAARRDASATERGVFFCWTWIGGHHAHVLRRAVAPRALLAARAAGRRAARRARLAAARAPAWWVRWHGHGSARSPWSSSPPVSSARSGRATCSRAVYWIKAMPALLDLLPASTVVTLLGGAILAWAVRRHTAAGVGIAAGGGRLADDGDRSPRPGRGRTVLLVAAAGACHRCAHSRLGGDRVRGARGVSDRRRPRVLHPPPHHHARAAAASRRRRISSRTATRSSSSATSSPGAGADRTRSRSSPTRSAGAIRPTASCRVRSTFSTALETDGCSPTATSSARDPRADRARPRRVAGLRRCGPGRSELRARAGDHPRSQRGEHLRRDGRVDVPERAERDPVHGRARRPLQRRPRACSPSSGSSATPRRPAALQDRAREVDDEGRGLRGRVPRSRPARRACVPARVRLLRAGLDGALLGLRQSLETEQRGQLHQPEPGGLGAAGLLARAHGLRLVPHGHPPLWHLSGPGERRAVPHVVRTDGDRAVLQPDAARRAGAHPEHEHLQSRPLPGTLLLAPCRVRLRHARLDRSPLEGRALARLLRPGRPGARQLDVVHQVRVRHARLHPAQRREEEPDHRDARDARLRQRAERHALLGAQLPRRPGLAARLRRRPLHRVQPQRRLAWSFAPTSTSAASSA